MNKFGKLKIFLLSLLAGSTLAATISSTTAWFLQRATFDFGAVTASSVGAYFGGGNGSSGSPYIINNKNHVYNLAWLQYLNYFVDDNGNPKQTYFRVDANIDMGGLAIPPIGTSRYPFIGIFNGNKKVISNLTVTNVIGPSSITRRPGAGVNSSNGILLDKDDDDEGTTEKQINILGFFGVVGELYDANGSYSYGSSLPAMKNYSLENIKVQNGASSALMGFGAGYVNATVAGVSIGSAKFEIPTSINALGKDNGFTDNVSDYSLVGYCTPDSLKTINITSESATVPKVEDGSASAGGNQFNASVPMKDWYDHLLGIKGTYSQQKNIYKYTSVDYVYLDSEGNEREAQSGESADTKVDNNFYVGRFGSPNNYSYASFPLSGTTAEDPSGNTIASYSFANRDNTDSFLYLYGQKEVTTNNPSDDTSGYGSALTKTVYTYQDFNANYIHDGSNYLAASTSGVSNASSSGARAWIFKDNRLYFYNNATPYYLTSASAGSLTISDSTSNANYWTYDETHSTYKNRNNLFLIYDDGWTTATSTSIYANVTSISFTSGENTYYLTAPSGEGNVTANTSSSTHWYKNGNYYYISVGGKAYNLRYTSSNAAYVSTSTSNRYYRATSTGNTSKLRYSNSNSSFLRYTGGAFTTSNNSGATTFTFTERQIEEGVRTISLTPISITERVGYETGVSNSYNVPPTYFPLTFNSDKTDVSPENTGYVVSGAHYESQPGDIRVSKYALSDLSSSIGPIAATSISTSIKLSTTTGSWFSTTTHYFSASGLSIVDVTSSSSATTWYINPWGNIFYLNGDKAYFLYGYNGSSNGLFLGEIGTYPSAYLAFCTSNQYIALPNPSGNTYVRYNNGWVTTTSSYYATTFSNISIPSISYNETIASSLEVITRVPKYDSYVRISDGYNYENNAVFDEIASLNKHSVEDLGLEKYNRARTSLNATLTDGVSNIYGLHFMDAQINANNKISIDRSLANGVEYLYDKTDSTNPYKMYNWQNVLDENDEPVKDDDNNYVYEKVFSSNTTGKYELPEDCIDFNLSKAGRITFFAGSYFGGNTAFFSLHQVFRNGPALSSIKEISQIYRNTLYNSVTNPDVPHYIYKYAGTPATYSATAEAGRVAFNESTDLVFDTSWITNLSDSMIENALYYFEIPVVGGEYALGSVPGRDGAYLMYLDIGAAAESNEITIVTEKITIDQDAYVVPKGIDFAVLPTSDNGFGYVAKDGGDIGTVVIPTGVYGSNLISFQLTGSQLTCGPPSTGSITTSTYIAATASIQCNGEPLTMTVNKNTKTVMDRETKYTYDPDNELLYTDVTTNTTVTENGTSSRTSSYIAPQTEEPVAKATYESRKLQVMAGSSSAYFQIEYRSLKTSSVDISYSFTCAVTSDAVVYNYVIKVVSNEAFTIFRTDTNSFPNFSFNVTIRRVNSTGKAFEDVTLAQGGNCAIYNQAAPSN
ncbi:MAG: hypothetical protein K6B65_05275 [Bacilli bacterium]|nr:hypothetical protein [Bacilli bacterium]